MPAWRATSFADARAPLPPAAQIDVDAPERDGDGSTCGKRAPWLHWMVTGAKGSAAAGRTVTDYMAPSPAIGVHRLIFLLFKGAVPEKKAEERITWDVSAFLNVHPNLTPVAFNFMCAACAAALAHALAHAGVLTRALCACATGM